jgi:serine/threonine protein kinase
VIGTLENLAPEQALGGKGDARSDIWALGILLYQMVTARLPFEDTQPERLTAKIIQGSYVPARDLAPSIPGSVGRIVERCLKIKPWERYQSATELLSAIDNATRQGNTGATRLARLWKDARGTPWIWALVVPALLLFLLLRMANPGPSTPPAVMPPPANLTPAPEPPRPPKPVPQPDNRDPNNKRKNPGESKTGEAVYDPYLIRQEAKPPEPPPQPQLPAPPQPQPQFPPQPTPPLVPKQRPVEQRKRGSAGKPIVIRVEAVEGPADLYVNGVLIPGRTPCSFQSIDGQEVELRLTRPGYQEFKTKITAGDRPGGLYRFSLKR